MKRVPAGMSSLARVNRPLSVERLEDRRLMATVDPILEWNAVAIEVNRASYSGGVVNDQIGPTRSSRALAIVHVAMFDAWNSIHGEFTPYLINVSDTKNASDEAAVAQAAHDTLVAMYPHQQAYIDAALTQSLALVPGGKAETRGINIGKTVAQAILAARTNDGSQIPGEYIPDGQIGHHAPDPLNPDQGFLTPAWGDVKPFGIVSTAQVPTRTVPALDTDEYAAAFDQVKTLGEETSTERTTDQTEIGIYWGYDVARGLGDPPRLYNQIARVIAAQQGNTVGENARMFALFNIAMADAGIQCWGVKYRDDFWRPIVAIRSGDIDGNLNTVGQADWSPLGAPRTNPLPTEHVNFTPPFPAYTSGHATFGGAAFKILANFYRTDDIDFSIPFDFISDEFNGVSTDIHDSIPGLMLDHVREMLPRHFESFSQAAAENAASRIFLGIHWRFDAIEGVSAGNRIADIVFDTRLRPADGQHDRHDHAPKHMASADFVAQIDAYLNNTYEDFFAPDNEIATAVLQAGGILAVMGSNGHDDLRLDAAAGELIVRDGSRTLGTFSLNAVAAIIINARGGNDFVALGNDIHVSAAISGGLGDDILIGGASSDSIYGDEGNDALFGLLGDDLLDGGDDNDLLFGGPGSDTLVGGAGKNRLIQ